MMSTLQPKLQLAADEINARETARGGKYVPLSAIMITYSEQENALVYRIDGTCALSHRMFWKQNGVVGTIAEEFNATLTNMSLFYGSEIHGPLARCQRIEYGAPGPPPAPPPPPRRPPPLQPPLAPPFSIEVTGVMRLSLNTVLDQLTPQSAQLFASRVHTWATALSDRVQVVANEGYRLSMRTSSLQDSPAAWLMEQMQQTADSAFCPKTTRCSNTASFSSVPPELTVDSVANRRLQSLEFTATADNATTPPNASTPSPPSRPTPPGSPPPPPAPPAPPVPPALPPSPPSVPGPSPPPFPFSPPLPPVLYEKNIFIFSSRTRNAGEARRQRALGETMSSQWDASLIQMPLHQTHNVAPPQATMTELSTDVRVTVITQNVSAAYASASDLFVLLLDSSNFRMALANELGIDFNALLVESLRAEFLDPDEGLIVISGSLPPPPPMAPTVDLEALNALAQQTASTVATVTAVIAGAVGASIAGAVAGSVGGSVAGSTGGAAGGAGAGGGGAAAGGVAPLIFGAQRFGASSGLAVEKSELQTGVADGLGWASGDFGIGSSDPPASDPPATDPPASDPPASDDALIPTERRRLQKKGSGGTTGTQRDVAGGEDGSAANTQQQKALGQLRSKLGSFYVVMGLLIGLMTAGSAYYRFRANRRYYRERGLNEFQRRALYKDNKKKGKHFVPKRAKFRSLPSAFVFPGILAIGCNLFLNGLIEPSITLVTFPGEIDNCGAECLVSAVAVLTMIALYISLTFAMLLHFHLSGHRVQTWKDADEPENPNDVEDPVYRFVSKVRTRLCVPGRKFNIMDRPRGEFVRCEADEAEPARTERLLSRPLDLFRSQSGDSLDALKLAWFQRGNGSGFTGVSYDLVAVLSGLAIAGMNGAGKNIQPGSEFAFFQVVVVLSIQLGTSLYVAIVRPSADRIDNWLSAAQFLVEGSQTGVLLLGSSLAADGDLDGSSACRTAGFWFGLAALFIPIVEKVYDAVISQISMCCRGEFDPVGFFYAFVALLLALPGTVATLTGFSLGEVDTVFGSVDEGVGQIEIGMGDGITIDEEMLDYASDLASDLFWMRSSKRHQEAALVIQSNFRGAHWRSMIAAAKGQAAQKLVARSRLGLKRRRLYKSQERELKAMGEPELATFIQTQREKRRQRQAEQAIKRAEREQRRLEILKKRHLADQRPQEDGEDTDELRRPGFEWLENLVDKELETLELEQEEDEESEIGMDSHYMDVCRMYVEISRSHSIRERTGVAIVSLPSSLPPSTTALPSIPQASPAPSHEQESASGREEEDSEVTSRSMSRNSSFKPMRNFKPVRFNFDYSV